MNNEIIPYGKQNITEDDIEAVVAVLRSDFLTQGPKIKEFENNFARYVGAKYAIAVANGTAALHLCTLTMGVKHGQKVITTPITFAATANCIRYCGGEVVFADIDPKSYLIDFESVKTLLKSSPRGTYHGIIPVDFAGRAVNLEKFRQLADEFNLWIIEDACHAPGGYFVDIEGNKQFCGNGNFADLSIFSFHPVKHIAAGEGGMITTNNEDLYKKLIKLRTHGITKNSDEFINTKSAALGKKTEDSCSWPGWYMEMQELGYNYRLTDFQAALGMSQLTRADVGLARRREIALKYSEAFDGKDFVLNQSGVIEGHAYHLYVINTKKRLDLYNYLRHVKIYPQIHYIPIHLMPYYKQFGWKQGDLPNAEEYYRSCLSLPMYPTLSREEQDYILEVIEKFEKHVI